MTKDEERARDFIRELFESCYMDNPSSIDESIISKMLLELIDEIRAEAAEMALRWVHRFGVELLHYDDKGNDLDPDPALYAAITGKEPTK